jgi:hypothetical protein
MQGEERQQLDIQRVKDGSPPKFQVPGVHDGSILGRKSNDSSNNTRGGEDKAVTGDPRTP